MLLARTEEARAERKWEVFRRELSRGKDSDSDSDFDWGDQSVCVVNTISKSGYEDNMTIRDDSPSTELDDIPPLVLSNIPPGKYFLLLILSLPVQPFFPVHTPVPPPDFPITPFLIRAHIIVLVPLPCPARVVLGLRIFPRWRWRSFMWCLRGRRRETHLRSDLPTVGLEELELGLVEVVFGCFFCYLVVQPTLTRNMIRIRLSALA